jgi:hypothetical protein
MPVQKVDVRDQNSSGVRLAVFSSGIQYNDNNYGKRTVMYQYVGSRGLVLVGRCAKHWTVHDWKCPVFDAGTVRCRWRWPMYRCGSCPYHYPNTRYSRSPGSRMNIISIRG